MKSFVIKETIKRGNQTEEFLQTFDKEEDAKNFFESEIEFFTDQFESDPEEILRDFDVDASQSAQDPGGQWDIRMIEYNHELIGDKLKKVGKIKSASDVFEIYLGTFIDNAFTWYSVAQYKEATKAYKEFKKYVNTQLKYTDEELQKVWDTGRLDIELRQGSKLLNWVGIYSREVAPLSKKEEEEVEKGEVKKKKDSISAKQVAMNLLKKMVVNYFYEDKITGEIIEQGTNPDLPYYVDCNICPTFDGKNYFAQLTMKFDNISDEDIGWIKKKFLEELSKKNLTADVVDRANEIQFVIPDDRDPSTYEMIADSKGKIVGPNLVETKGIHEERNEDPAFDAFVKTALKKFSSGDWGDCSADDKAANDRAAKDNSDMILGSYKFDDKEIWIITDYGGETTTILFPHEY